MALNKNCATTMWGKMGVQNVTLSKSDASMALPLHRYCWEPWTEMLQETDKQDSRQLWEADGGGRTGARWVLHEPFNTVLLLNTCTYHPLIEVKFLSKKKKQNL